MENQRKGKAGEDRAAEYLQSIGYEIIQRNYRCPYGEVDILARHKDFLVFVEVKARSGSFFGRPCEAVNLKKRAKIISCAQNYLAENMMDCGIRFDVVEVFLPKRGNNLAEAEVNLISNAFTEV